jgi:ribosomal-protein-alanine N-acetyltransferase
MTLADLPQVMNIDRLSFDVPWAERSYQYEIAESENSYMVVLEFRRLRPVPRWQQWLNLTPVYERRIAGYGGLWHIESEAHISTIAAHPQARGRGWGELLLAGMINRSITLHASEVMLEVRVSNSRAQNLYRKYNFTTVDVKKGYYRNNNEDAYIMRLRISNDTLRSTFQRHYAELMAVYQFNDFYSTTQLPARVSRAYFF